MLALGLNLLPDLLQAASRTERVLRIPGLAQPLPLPLCPHHCVTIALGLPLHLGPCWSFLMLSSLLETFLFPSADLPTKAQLRISWAFLPGLPCPWAASLHTSCPCASSLASSWAGCTCASPGLEQEHHRSSNGVPKASLRAPTRCTLRSDCILSCLQNLSPPHSRPGRCATGKGTLG